MEQSVGLTIEKIKMQEQAMEAKLREKREYEATITMLNTAIKNTISETNKSRQEQLAITRRIEKLRPSLEIQKLKRDALSIEIKTLNKMLEDLKSQSDQGIKNVWSVRSLLCKTVKEVSDECDIWALLTRPIIMDPSPQIVIKSVENDEKVGIHEVRLKSALERRERAIAERELLLSEPDTSEEFIRIKNALRYTLDKIESFNK